MKKVAFLDIVHQVLEEGLTASGWECSDFTSTAQADIIRQINQYHGIVIRSRFPMNEAFLRHASNLEFIARSGAGMENIDVTYCNSKNIELFNAPEGNRNAVGEQALGMLLALFNKIVKSDREVRNGVWDREGNRGIELEGKTVGIIGYGNNGRAFAKKLQGFDVNVITYDKYLKDYGDQYAKEVAFDKIFELSDIVSFHIPQNNETIGMGNTDFFNRFLKPIYVLNLARGKIINTEDLVTQLKSGKVQGACLDVLEYEKSSFEDMFSNSDSIPEAFAFLLKSDRVILTPHVGGWSVESYYKLSETLLKKVKKYYKL